MFASSSIKTMTADVRGVARLCIPYRANTQHKTCR